MRLQPCWVVPRAAPWWARRCPTAASPTSLRSGAGSERLGLRRSAQEGCSHAIGWFVKEDGSDWYSAHSRRETTDADAGGCTAGCRPASGWVGSHVRSTAPSRAPANAGPAAATSPDATAASPAASEPGDDSGFATPAGSPTPAPTPADAGRLPAIVRRSPTVAGRMARRVSSASSDGVLGCVAMIVAGRC